VAFKEPGSTVIVVPALDLAELLGQRTLPLPHRPAGLEVTATFDDALDLLEIHALSRAMGPSGNDPYTRWRPTFILIASTSRYDRARLQVTLDLGSGYGIAGLLHGQWQPGVTVSVRADGSAVPGDPGLSKLMRDVRWVASAPNWRPTDSLASAESDHGSLHRSAEFLGCQLPSTSA
jgi:hypothetical protein